METQQDQKATVTQEAPKPTQQPVQSQQEAKPVARRTNKELLDFIVETGESGKDYARQVVEQEIAKDLFDQDWRLARVFAESGVFDDLKDKSSAQAIATAMAKIQLGRYWNLNPSEAMQFVYFTNGRPGVMTELFASKLKQAGYDWHLAHDYEETVDGKRRKRKCIGCTIFPMKFNPKSGEYEHMTMRRRTDSGAWETVELEVSFDLTEAEGATIHEKGGMKPLAQKWNYQSWGEDMYTWRALSKFRRRYAPHILTGATLPGEVSIEVEEIRQSAPSEGTLEAAHEVLRRKLEDLDNPQQHSEGGGEVASEQVATAKGEEQTASGHAAGTTVKSPSAPAPGLFEGGLGGKRK